MPLRNNIVNAVKKMLGEGIAPKNDAPVSFFHVAIHALRSSRATPLSGTMIVPLAPVQKLENKMVTLFHHHKSWI